MLSKTRAAWRIVQAVFFRRRHQPRRPPLAKIMAGQSSTDDGAVNRCRIAFF
jgi:hypothetical protein